MKNLYEVLGVKKESTLSEIRKSYRKLAVKLHPDRNPGDYLAEQKYKEISEAYGILSSDEKRKKYDLETNPIQAPPPNYPVSNTTIDVEISPRDFECGAIKSVTVSRPRTCPDCRGTGRINQRVPRTCSLCLGRGCAPCEWKGVLTHCARCWATGSDRELTVISIEVPAHTPVHGRHKLVASGDLWGLRGPFYIYANVKWRSKTPGLIVR